MVANRLWSAYQKRGVRVRRKRVGVLTTYHLHDDGKRIIYGGAERYGVEFTKLLLEMGFEVAWWQAGSGWTSEMVPGVPLYSAPLTDGAYQTCPSLNHAFHEQADRIDFAVYFSPLLAYPVAHEKSVSISHGIYWDYPTWESRVAPTEADRREWRHRYRSALERPRKIVSCDTATIRYINATWPGLAAKLEYIPNFVDLTQFTPPEHDVPRDTIRVLYPRRLAGVRGIHETLSAAERLIDRYPQLEFHIVGRGHGDAFERRMLEWAERHPRLFYYWRPPHEMPHIYRHVDIVLIPTTASEGTSLSCLEAMATGRAVIAGCVGGLTDLIIDGYNGLLLRPLTANSLAEAVERLIVDRELRIRLGKRARMTAEAFSLERWKARWAEVIDDVFR